MPNTTACAASSQPLPVSSATARTTLVSAAPKRGPRGSTYMGKCSCRGGSRVVRAAESGSSTQAGGHAAQVDRAPAPQACGGWGAGKTADFHDTNLTQLMLASATEGQPTTAPSAARTS